MRKLIKILHTTSACGLIGGLLAYTVLLFIAKPDDLAAYAELRAAIAAISNYVLLPSLAVALISGLFSMAVHAPFINMGWAWIKAGLGLLMFKGVLGIVSAKADNAAIVAKKIAEGRAAPEALAGAMSLEWWTLGTILMLSMANVVLGIWRPPLRRRQPSKLHRVTPSPGAVSAGGDHRTS